MKVHAYAKSERSRQASRAGDHDAQGIAATPGTRAIAEMMYTGAGNIGVEREFTELSITFNRERSATDGSTVPLAVTAVYLRGPSAKQQLALAESLLAALGDALLRLRPAAKEESDRTRRAAQAPHLTRFELQQSK